MSIALLLLSAFLLQAGITARIGPVSPHAALIALTYASGFAVHAMSRPELLPWSAWSLQWLALTMLALIFATFSRPWLTGAFSRLRGISAPKTRTLGKRVFTPD